MADRINDGGAAFPIPNDDRPGAYPAEPGMSLREWFAGQALAGLTMNLQWQAKASWQVPCVRSAMIEEAYLIADAMIAARKGGAA